MESSNHVIIGCRLISPQRVGHNLTANDAIIVITFDTNDETHLYEKQTQATPN
jgi:hypothetical protein